MKEKVRKLGLDDSVKFLGRRDDINELYQAFDVFCLPSLYEGLGMVAIEAQINNLYVLASIEVPIEAQISNKIEFLKLDTETWKEKLIEKKDNRKEKIIKSDDYNLYDIKEQAQKLENKYKEMIINYEQNKR